MKWYMSIKATEDSREGAVYESEYRMLYDRMTACVTNARPACRSVVVEVKPLLTRQTQGSPYRTAGIMRKLGKGVVVRAVPSHELASGMEQELCTTYYQGLFMADAIDGALDRFNLHDVPDSYPEEVTGWKALSQGMTAYDNFLYELGKQYAMKGIAALCNRGFHFCQRCMSDVYHWYPMSRSTRVFEVLAGGRVVQDKDMLKSAATRIRLVRELSPAEMLRQMEADVELGRWDAGTTMRLFMAGIRKDLAPGSGQAGGM